MGCSYKERSDLRHCTLVCAFQSWGCAQRVAGKRLSEEVESRSFKVAIQGDLLRDSDGETRGAPGWYRLYETLLDDTADAEFSE